MQINLRFSVASLSAFVLSLGSPCWAFDRSSYNPAILSFSLTDQPLPSQSTSISVDASSFLDISLITVDQAPVSTRVLIDRAQFKGQLRKFYKQIARQDALRVSDPLSPSRQLYSALIKPIEAKLLEYNVSSLLLAADQGLQAIPFAALHSGDQFFGISYPFAITPSIRLTSLSLTDQSANSLLAAGSSQFDLLAPLPTVEDEITRISAFQPTEVYLNEAFTGEILQQRISASKTKNIHIATHAEFHPGGPDRAVLHTAHGAMSLADFSRIRNRDDSRPIDLFALSACRTALGDEDSELGFAGLALQAGSRSAIGTLWYVDDVITSAFFVQLYKYLQQGIPKAEALQMVRRALAEGTIRLEGDSLVGADDLVLLAGLDGVQVERARAQLNHPFFWAGLTLIGAPW